MNLNINILNTQYKMDSEDYEYLGTKKEKILKDLEKLKTMSLDERKTLKQAHLIEIVEVFKRLMDGKGSIKEFFIYECYKAEYNNHKKGNMEGVVLENQLTNEKIKALKKQQKPLPKLMDLMFTTHKTCMERYIKDTTAYLFELDKLEEATI